MAIENFFHRQPKNSAEGGGGPRRGPSLAAENNLKVLEFTPLEVKMAMTGYGRAEKDQVRKMVMAMLKMGSDKKPRLFGGQVGR